MQVEQSPEKGFLNYLEGIIPPSAAVGLPATLVAAMRSGLFPIGKLFRATLLLRACAACGGVPQNAFALAAALEMVHAYSLVHDDLACMDNADTRRGLPAVHRLYGEAMGVLAGDGLLTHAFAVAASAPLPTDVTLACLAELARLSGFAGMAGGQSVDVESEQEGRRLDLTALLEMYRMKTGALFVAAVKMGCMAAGAGGGVLEAAEGFGYALGVGYQILDDLLDITGDPALLGKPVGVDARNQKRPITAHLPMGDCRELLNDYRKKAMSFLRYIPHGELLQPLLEQALDRQK